MTDCQFTVVMAVIAIIALVPTLLHWWLFRGKQMTSFQIHDDCPEWFLERVNAELDKKIKQRSKGILSEKRRDATLS